MDPIALMLAIVTAVSMLVGLVTILKIEDVRILPLIGAAWTTTRDAVKRALVGPEQAAAIEHPYTQDERELLYTLGHENARRWGEDRAYAEWARDNPGEACGARWHDTTCFLPASHDDESHRGHDRNGETCSWNPWVIHGLGPGHCPVEGCTEPCARCRFAVQIDQVGYRRAVAAARRAGWVIPPSRFLVPEPRLPDPSRPDCDDCDWTLIRSMQGPVRYVRSDTCDRHRPQPCLPDPSRPPELR